MTSDNANMRTLRKRISHALSQKTFAKECDVEKSHTPARVGGFLRHRLGIEVLDNDACASICARIIDDPDLILGCPNFGDSSLAFLCARLKQNAPKEFRALLGEN